MTENPNPKDEQRGVAELLRSFDDVPAPDALHRRIDSMIASRQRRRSPAVLAGVGAAAAIVIAVVVVIASGGGGGALSFDQAAAPALRAATLAAPPQNQAEPAQLTLAVDGIPFPSYRNKSFPWHSTGARIDRVDGRSITTVFYSDGSGGRIGYAILAGTPAPWVSGGTVVRADGVAYRQLVVNGAQTVTWLRDGHLCVIAGRGVSSSRLLALASWSENYTSIT